MKIIRLLLGLTLVLSFGSPVVASEQSEAELKQQASQTSGYECPICLQDLVGEASVSITPCIHIFHNSCLARCENLCPVCREDVSTSLWIEPSPINIIDLLHKQKVQNVLRKERSAVNALHILVTGFNIGIEKFQQENANLRAQLSREKRDRLVAMKIIRTFGNGISFVTGFLGGLARNHHLVPISMTCGTLTQATSDAEPAGDLELLKSALKQWVIVGASYGAGYGLGYGAKLLLRNRVDLN